MAVELATAYVSLIASAKDLTKSVEAELGRPLQDAAADAGEKAGRSFGQRFSDSADKLTDFGKKGAAVTAGLATGLFAAAKAAGGLEAAIAANEQVLDEASGAVQAWAETSVDAVGLSERAAVEASTSFGQLAKIAGESGQGVADFSIEMVQLAADMAAFKDVPVDQALADLQSGFAGSTEVMRKYAIFLDDAGLKNAYFTATGETVTGTLTAQQRVIATHAEIMRQSADMQGQWGRESEGLAGQQAKLKAEFENLGAAVGESVLPVFARLVGGGADLMSRLGELDAVTGGTVGKFAGLATAAIGVVSAVSLVAGQTAKMRDRLTDSTGGLNNFGKAAGGAATALAGIGIAFSALEVFDQLAGRTGDVTDEFNAFVASTGKADRTTADVVQRFGDLAEAAATSQSSLGMFGDLVGSGFDATKARAEAMAETFDSVIATSPEIASTLVADLDRVVQAAAAGSEAAQGFVDHWGLTPEVLAGFRAQADDATGAADALATAATGIADETGAAVEPIEETGWAALDAKDRFEELEKAFSTYLDAVRGSRDAQWGYRDATRDVAVATWDLSEARKAVIEDPTIENTTELQMKVEDLQVAYLDQIDAAARNAEQQAILAGATFGAAEAAQAQIDEATELASTLAPNSPLAMFLNGYIDDLLRTPGSVDTRLELDKAQAVTDLEAWSQALGGLGSAETHIRALIDQGSLRAAHAEILSAAAAMAAGIQIRMGAQRVFGPVRLFADGTDYAPGGLAVVGEEGPELVHIPRGSQVFDAPTTARMRRESFGSLRELGGATPPAGRAGGGGVTIEGDVIVQDGRSIYSELRLVAALWGGGAG